MEAEAPPYLDDALVLAALGQVDVGVLPALDALVLDGGELVPDGGGQIGTGGHVVALEVPHGHVDGPDRLGVQDRPLGPHPQGDVLAVDAAEAYLSHLGGDDGSPGALALCGIVRGGGEGLHVPPDQAQLRRQPLVVAVGVQRHGFLEDLWAGFGFRCGCGG